MADMESKASKELRYCGSYEGNSRTSVTDAALVPLDTSEDAQFSDQMFISIQERLNRINSRVQKTTLAIAQLQQALRLKSFKNVKVEGMFAGGDIASNL
ncbi:hypothetical protein KR018_000060 [Drosophila ironensis]|nr:hypothetical protein KR018_000060 [Drosophila ironensis]